MLDVLETEHPSDLDFNEFIGRLIEDTKNTQPKSENYEIVEDTDDHLRNLEKAFTYLSKMAEKKKIASSGVEWFLDNYFVIQQAVELIRDDLPEVYFNKLPAINDNKKTPRIYVIARSIIAYYEIELMRNDLHDFLTAYQKEIPLRMSELWALPLLLRLTLVEILAGTIFDLIDQEKPLVETDNIEFSNREEDEIIARSLRTLLLFDRFDWKELFERHSRVEEILRKDPDKTYKRMDFETRDEYRKSVENLAEKADFDEIEVAKAAINLAENPQENLKIAKHVGYYLVDDGKEQLKSKIGFTYDLPAWIWKFFFDNNTAFYFGSLFLITFLVVLGLVLISNSFMAQWWGVIIIGIISIIPASSVAVNLINSILTAVLPPNTLPKMDFSKRIPKKFRTMVAIPALLTDQEEVDFLLEQIELHYLANRDRNIGFVLLTDLIDALQETLPEDEILLNSAVDGINALNECYRGEEGRRPFFLVHRCRQWNPKEDVWMGWERKRGKLGDFNRFIMEGFDESFQTIIGDVDFIKPVRFVITVDADTVLPRDSANALIATLAHPLNHAEFEEGTARVKRGYTILQPRTEVKPTSVIRSLFTRIFAGDLGIDLYTRAVSDVYQDLFGEGIYVGKGIYEVETFQKSLKDKAPNDALLSHDLFEGLQGRAGLVTDIVFFEEYPPNYATYIQRLHRWVRGDWQLLPWLFQQVPTADEEKEPNPFKPIDLWRIFDNLRRSLVSPFTLFLFIAGWMMFDEHAWTWTLLIVLVSAFPLFNNIVTSLSTRFLTGASPNIIADLENAFFRWVFSLVFLPYESLTMIDAIATTLTRVFISHNRLLQWQTSAHTVRIFGKQRKIITIWQRMIGAPLISIAIGVLIYFTNWQAFWFSLPLLLLWALSPQIAYWASLERDRDKKAPLTEKELQRFKNIARRTWLYFERFIGPDDHWLPPDHFQEDPKGVVAHRTSPTNIGLMLLSTVAAYDFGYIGLLDFIYRMNYAFATLDGLEKYRGHLLNWYDTQSQATLSPRYVSTVDSGNFATSLIGLYQSLKLMINHKICPSTLYTGVFDALDVFCNVVNLIENQELKEVSQTLLNHCRNIQKDIQKDHLCDSRQLELLEDFNERLSEPMSVLINQLIGTEKTIKSELVQDLRYWSEAVFQQINNIHRQIEMLAPWMLTWRNRPEFLDNIESFPLDDAFTIWHEDRALETTIFELPELCGRVIKEIEVFLEGDTSLKGSGLDKKQKDTLVSWLGQFKEDLQESRKTMQDLHDQISSLLEKINFYIERMEFNFLYDKQREVFYLGYQVGSGRLDKNHYDLLSSEARTASLFAIAQNEVPRSHWLHMSRPFTMVDGIPTLVSWNGSMFEYLMPNLFTRSYPETLLHQTGKGVVKAQKDYAKQNNVPWGISESSYYRFDQAENYQYKGFGVPGLGRKRGLANDLVIAPYASLMAVDIDPKAVLANMDALNEEGALGRFGYFESIDYTKSRLPVGQDKAIIKSYMAHHQGMIFVALANLLNNTSIVDRVHLDPRIQSTELLLQEQIPQAEPIKKTKEIQVSTRGQEATGINVSPWPVDVNRPGKDVHLISNGNLQLMMTETGSGYLAWKDIALTRWRQDGILDPWGIWFYVQDLSTEKAWSVGRQPIQSNSDDYHVIYAPHMTEIRHEVDDVRVIIQTTIPPKEDICLQKISFTNQSNEERNYRLLSYGEVVLAPQATDKQHPAFNKMFIESSYLDDLKMLHYHRRKRSSDEEPRGMAHLIVSDQAGEVEFESDRLAFIGRGHNFSNPIALKSLERLNGRVGITLDPVFSLGKRFRLEPNQTITITYVTLVAATLEEAKTIARRYQDEIRIDNAFSSAESDSEKLLRALGFETQRLSKYQKLLSYIVYPNPALRPEPAVLVKNELGQSGLWSFGISGDYPILLVMINQQEDIEKVREVLLAHSYGCKLGLMIDVVILNTKDMGYTHELNEKIHQAINLMDSQSWVNQRGGIFVLTASQMENKSLLLLKTAASAIIDFKDGSLEDHLQKAAVIKPDLPNFVPNEQDKVFATDKSLVRPDNLIMDNDIGGFTPDGREYQIYLQNTPKLQKEIGQLTPAPWINVIANENFGCLVSESGGGYTWSINSGENRLTPWTNDPVSDPSGESLYLRDEITGKIWSPTLYPAGEGTDYLVKHGQGYTIFESYHHGFKQILKIFTDPQAPVKIVELTLINQAEEHRRLTATYYAEWVLGSDRETSKAFIIPSFDNQTGSLMARNTYSAEFSERVAFLTSDQTVHGLTTDRLEFLGSPGNRQKPASLTRVGLSGQVKAGVDPCAALQTHINFEPGESQKITFILGQGQDAEEAKQLAEAFSRPETIQESWTKSLENWDKILNTLQVETPQQEMDLILNRWLLYQALSCRIWGRSALYQSSGAYGFRDQLQDVISLMAVKPDLSRAHILRSARHQFDAGDVLHWWHPPSGRGVRTRITDDLLWLVYVTAEYVKKTGDTAILEEEIPFIVGEKLNESEEERYGHYESTEKPYTLFEHCRRALNHGDTIGPHGLPLIGSGDWNDGMNRVGIEGQGESVWLGWFLYENYKRFADLCDLLEKPTLAEEQRRRAAQLKETINQVAWDDEWFLRAYYDDGTPLGSHRNEECQIDSLPQSWSVLTQGASQERQVQALKSVEKHLVQKNDQLLLLFTPPFDKTEKDPGYIKGYPPGIRENGGQYTHGAIWAVWALTELGQGNKAFEQFSYLNPITHSLNLDSANRYAVEPYVVAADIYSTPPYIGRGGWTWYTGSSGWLYRLGTEAILGLRLRGDHFIVDPCIPDSWEGFKMTFRQKACTYHIQVENPDRIEKGIREVRLDDDTMPDQKIPLQDDESEHDVTIIMGK